MLTVGAMRGGIRMLSRNRLLDHVDLMRQAQE